MASNERIEYICSWCGKRALRYKANGRPEPGVCPRKPKGRDGKPRPHTWMINRRFS